MQRFCRALPRTTTKLLRSRSTVYPPRRLNSSSQLAAAGWTPGLPRSIEGPQAVNNPQKLPHTPACSIILASTHIFPFNYDKMPQSDGRKRGELLKCLSCIFAHQDPAFPDDDEPRFLECVKLNFDEAAKYSKMNPGLLEVPKIKLQQFSRSPLQLFAGFHQV
jgi:hypothetical protein